LFLNSSLDSGRAAGDRLRTPGFFHASTGLPLSRRPASRRRPGHGIQIADAPEIAGRFEAHEPSLPIIQFDQASLMRAPRRKHLPAFIGAVNIFRAQNRLPAGADAAFGKEI